MLSDERLAEIEALAKAATPGPYRACGCGKCGLVWSTVADVPVYNVAKETDDEPGVDSEQRDRNRLFAAAASPDMTLAIIAELREARAQADRLRHERNELGKAIAGSALAAGIYNGDGSLTGPDLILFARSLGERARWLWPLDQAALAAEVDEVAEMRAKANALPVEFCEVPHCVPARVNEFLTPGGKAPPGWPEAG